MAFQRNVFASNSKGLVIILVINKLMFFKQKM